MFVDWCDMTFTGEGRAEEITGESRHNSPRGIHFTHASKSAPSLLKTCDI